MSWLPQQYGPGPASEAAQYRLQGLHPPGANLTRPVPNLGQQIMSSLQAAAPALAQVMQQRKSDEIANQLQNMINPPRAQAVGGIPQGAPATSPFTGGARGAAVLQAYQAILDKKKAEDDATREGNQKYDLGEEQLKAARQGNIPDSATDDAKLKLLQAQADEARNVADSPAAAPQTIPAQINGMTVPLTPDAYARYVGASSGKAKPDSQESINNDIFNTTGQDLPSWLNQPLKTNPDGSVTGNFTDKEGQNPYTRTMPYALYQKTMTRLNALNDGGAAPVPPPAHPNPDATTPTPNPALSYNPDGSAPLPQPDPGSSPNPNTAAPLLQPTPGGSPGGQPSAQTAVATLSAARAAIAAGKDPAAVKQRLSSMGIDPSGL